MFLQNSASHKCLYVGKRVLQSASTNFYPIDQGRVVHFYHHFESCDIIFYVVVKKKHHNSDNIIIGRSTSMFITDSKIMNNKSNESSIYTTTTIVKYEATTGFDLEPITTSTVCKVSMGSVVEMLSISTMYTRTLLNYG